MFHDRTNLIWKAGNIFFYLSKSMIAFFKSTLSMENQFSSINEKEAQCDWECNTEL